MNKSSGIRISSYLILFSGLILGFFFFSVFSYNRKLQLLIGFLMSGYYLIWGILNHLIKGDLTLKVIIEYVLISLLGIVILSSLLFRT